MPDRPIVVAGLGVHGRAVVAALTARGLQAVAFDDRPTQDHEVFASNLGVRFLGAPDGSALRELLAGASEVVPTPGLPERHPLFALAASLGVPVISELDLAARWDQRPVVAITGTNGKTTVTMMVTAILEASGIAAAAVGNTELPLVAALDDAKTQLFVFEASSFRLGHSQHFAPAVGTWLNFAADHLDVHVSLDRYEEAKGRIWAQQGPADVAIGVVTDPVVARHLLSAPGRRVEVGSLAGYHEANGQLWGDDGVALLATKELTRSLPHDVLNALAAAATARASGGTLAAVRSVLTGWQHLPHRVQLVAERDGVQFYDDSKATTPHAVIAAASGFSSIVLIAGGRNKGLDLGELAQAVTSIRAVVAIGEAAAEVEAAFAGLRPVVVANSMDEAVARAAGLAKRGDTVLLSPGTASFDWYRSYGERGDDFARAVKQWLAEESQ